MRRTLTVITLTALLLTPALGEVRGQEAGVRSQAEGAEVRGQGGEAEVRSQEAGVRGQGDDAAQLPGAGVDEQLAEAGAQLPGATIQIALLLDTSGSMSGLIRQAQAHLWSVVNQFAQTRHNGRMPNLQVALFEYGNDGLPGEENYIRMVTPLTTDLDKVSEDLFALTTNGGSEYCGAVIDKAARTLTWTDSHADYKAIFIAGNEPFTQGPVAYQDACAAAIAQGIIVNTIHCGSEEQGRDGQWHEGAALADGSYMVIDHEQAIVAIESPQDEELARLNSELNDTYLFFGAEAEAAEKRQLAQDDNAANLAPQAAAARINAKASGQYRNRADLVDAAGEKDFDLADVPAEELPEPMQAMSAQEREAHVAAMAQKRAELQEKILELSKERDAYVAEQRRELAEQGGDDLGAAMLGAVREQLVEKGYEFAE